MQDWMNQVMLRHLAGRYFLIRRGQRWPDYKRPVETDESGAAFWKLLAANNGKVEDAADELAASCSISRIEAREDLRSFLSEVADQLGFGTEE